jgi:hypothetical protein
MNCRHRKKYCDCELKAAVTLAMKIDFGADTQDMLNALWHFIEKASRIEMHEEKTGH